MDVLGVTGLGIRLFIEMVGVTSVIDKIKKARLKYFGICRKSV